MDRTDRGATWRSVVVRALLAATLAASSCTQTEHKVGVAEVHPQRPDREVLGSAKILRDGEQVGSLRTLRLHEAGRSRVLDEVQDLHRNSLGFIDEQNCAYRLGAHTGSQLVSNSSDRRRGVAAILGAYSANIEIVEEQPASVTDRQAAQDPPRPR
jgi:hypothetical protein